jgi:hypothetical protein
VNRYKGHLSYRLLDPTSTKGLLGQFLPRAATDDFTRAQTPVAAARASVSSSPRRSRSCAAIAGAAPQCRRSRAVAAAVPPYVVVAHSATPSTLSSLPAALLRRQRGERPFSPPLPLSPPPVAPPTDAAAASPASPLPGHAPWLAGALSPRAPATRSMKCGSGQVTAR